MGKGLGMQIQTTYASGKTVPSTFDKTEQKVRSELQKEDVGIISEIDDAAKIKENLDKDFRHNIILGACNPALALIGNPEVSDLALTVKSKLGRGLVQL
jgi:uncharacterized protein (DUF302 family)